MLKLYKSKGNPENLRSLTIARLLLCVIGFSPIFLLADSTSNGRSSSASTTIKLSIPEHSELRGLTTQWQAAQQGLQTPFCLRSDNRSAYSLSTDRRDVQLAYHFDDLMEQQQSMDCARDERGLLKLENGSDTLNGIITVIVAAQ